MPQKKKKSSIRISIKHFNWTPTLEVISKGSVQSKYQYLDEDYYAIKDRSQQIKKKNEFIKEFKVFMNHYFKE